MRLFAVYIAMATCVRCGPAGSIDGSSSFPGSKANEAEGRVDPNKGSKSPPIGDTSFDLTKCGYSLDSQTAIIASQQLAMESSTITVSVPVLGGIFQSKKTVTINGTFIMETSLNRQTVSYKSTSSPSIDSAEVTAALAASTGSGDATIMDSDDRAKIGETNPEWAGIFCTLQPATRIERNSDTHVTTEFSQPVPYGVIAAGDVERLKTEWGTKRTWSNVVAKIVESTNPSIQAGTALTGNVVAEPIKMDPSSPLGDIALRITYNFGGAEKNQMIGLPASIVWYVDSASHKVKSVQVDTTGGAPVAFK